MGHCRSMTIAAAVTAALLMVTTAAHATTVTCQRAIAKASAQFVQAKVKALSKCETSKVTGKLPLATVCTTEFKTAAAITKARGKLTTAIGKSCGGDDKVCGGDLTNEDTPGSLEWPSFCPNFELGSCNNAIATCGDIATCLACVGEAAVDQAIDLYYDDLVQGTRDDKALNKCQVSIGKATAAFLGAKAKALQQCWDARLNGTNNRCAPLTSPYDDKPIAAIAKADAKKRDTICKACGGADKACGGGDDLTPSQIGFPATCPAVTIPGGAACGALITDLQSIVDCVDCVTEFKADCVDRLQVPQYAAYPAGCNACLVPPPTGPCPTSLEFTGDGANADYDTGWTGLAHNATLPSNGRLTLAVSGCDNTNYPNCGECDVNGPLENAGGGTFNNHRCQDQPWVQCSDDTNCTNAGATGPCIFFFGPPQPLAVGGVGVCILNKISGPITGTLNPDNGSLMTKVMLSSGVYVGGPDIHPCPQCNGGVCTDGPRIGQSCSVNGTGLFGDVSLDCPPNPGSKYGALGMTWDLATGPQTRALSTANPKCRQNGYTGLKCFCDTCNNVDQETCSSNADCSPNPLYPSNPGICGGKRCIQGSEAGKPCNTCIGGTNHGASCSDVSQCPGGACPIGCAGVCIGGTNDGGSCSVSSSCPGFGGHCSAFCSIPGEPTQPSACIDDPGTPLSGCQSIGGNEGECADGPIDATCSIQTFQSCALNSDCDPSFSCPQCLAGQTCVLRHRSCFTDNGVIGNSVSVAGNPDAPCGGVAKPSVGALFCVPPISSALVNAAYGLPGLGRVRIPGTVVIGP